MKEERIGKRGFSLPGNMTAWWILAILVLALGLFLASVLLGKGEGALGFLKDIFRFGR
tara:strand:+ start:40 stop:213 length:174 start_codon:yes stop_codon:yes gene_type:complete